MIGFFILNLMKRNKELPKETHVEMDNIHYCADPKPNLEDRDLELGSKYVQNKDKNYFVKTKLFKHNTK